MFTRQFFSTSVVVVLLLTMFLISSGCTRRVIDFTVISSKNTAMRVTETGKGNRVVGKDGVAIILFIPLGVPHLKEAVDRAIESAGPEYDALIDGVIYSSLYWFIFGYQGFKVKGTPIKSSELRTELLQDGKYAEVDIERVLFHSSLGISNEKAIEEIGVVQVKDLDNIELASSAESVSR